MYVSKRQQEIEDAERVAVGLPSLRCPNCSELGAHWEPDTLTTRGHYICGDTNTDGPRSSGWYGGNE